MVWFTSREAAAAESDEAEGKFSAAESNEMKAIKAQH